MTSSERCRTSTELQDIGHPTCIKKCYQNSCTTLFPRSIHESLSIFSLSINYGRYTTWIVLFVFSTARPQIYPVRVSLVAGGGAHFAFKHYLSSINIIQHCNQDHHNFLTIFVPSLLFRSPTFKPSTPNPAIFNSDF